MYVGNQCTFIKFSLIAGFTYRTWKWNSTWLLHRPESSESLLIKLYCYVIWFWLSKKMTKKSLDMDKFVEVFSRKPRRIPGLILTCSDRCTKCGVMNRNVQQ